MKRKFKMEITFEIDGDISTEQFKNHMKRKVDDFTLYNDITDKETEVEIFDYWNNVVVIEIP